MERLTRRELWWGSQGKTDKAIDYKVDEERRCVTHEGSSDFLIADKLAEYEDLEEQGKLLKLPYTVGDTVYVFLPNDNHFTKAQINKIEVKRTIYGKMCYFIEPVGNRGHLYRYFEDDFGKTVFSTKESALQKMNEMEGKE